MSAAATVLVVSTECPTCGAPLHFDEGSSAVRCDHCGSSLLVTGRRRVLSYFVRPRVPGDEARALAHFSRRSGESSEARLGEPLLCFVPYYRLTATELRWQHPAAADAERERLRDAERDWSFLDRRMASFERVALGEAGPSAPPRSLRRRCVEFAGRRIERNLRASAGAIGAPSLGVRASVVRLELHRADALPEGSVVCPVDLPADEALRIGSEPMDEDGLVRRAVVGRLLSLVHFPLWVLPSAASAGPRVVTVDGVSGAVTEHATASGELDRLCARGAHEPRATVGFRPLACPNCAWDLPVEPSDVVFQCPGCDRAWLIDGEELVPQPVAIAAPPAGARATFDYRPFWDLPRDPTGGAGVARCLVPAFRHPNLKRLNDLAVRLSRRAGAVTPVEGPGRDLRGCAIDAADAAAIACFLAAGETPDGNPLLGPPKSAPAYTSDGAQLLWLPFVREAYGWREPITGTALPPELAA
ncbi:MAG TPA: hypothetical protein VFD92_21200 [Candidatus Binatia bacterium]|nr:hypothetical protein [Candidatus Binatia bacterium]